MEEWGIGVFGALFGRYCRVRVSRSDDLTSVPVAYLVDKPVPGEALRRCRTSQTLTHYTRLGHTQGHPIGTFCALVAVQEEKCFRRR
jgi:hypothetical protein